MKKILKVLFIFIIGIFTMISCNNKPESKSDKIKVTTTLNYYVNLVEEIGKEKVDVTGLMGEGEDPHLYVASAKDVEKLNSADLIVFGGLHLEGKMGDIFENLSNKYILDLGSKLDPKSLKLEEENVYDPHVWFNTNFWSTQATAVAEMLSEISPENKEYFNENLKNYLEEINKLNEYISNRITEIPENSRVLITAHDAFGYFADQFGLTVKAIQGISTDSEIGSKDIEDLANFIVENKIKAIFVESSVNSKSILALQEAVKNKGFEVSIGGELYSDSMGDKEHNADSYIKTLKANVDTIVNALK